MGAAPNRADASMHTITTETFMRRRQAFTYVFDRITGAPIFPIEERPVPRGSIPGEWYSPTQPFPTRPPAFDRQGVTVNDLVDVRQHTRISVSTRRDD
jgi:glucose dehydrogenase